MAEGQKTFELVVEEGKEAKLTFPEDDDALEAFINDAQGPAGSHPSIVVTSKFSEVQTAGGEKVEVSENIAEIKEDSEKPSSGIHFNFTKDMDVVFTVNKGTVTLKGVFKSLSEKDEEPEEEEDLGEEEDDNDE